MYTYFSLFFGTSRIWSVQNVLLHLYYVLIEKVSTPFITYVHYSPAYITNVLVHLEVFFFFHPERLQITPNKVIKCGEKKSDCIALFQHIVRSI